MVAYDGSFLISFSLMYIFLIVFPGFDFVFFEEIG